MRELKERSSIKDIIESCGVPHPEVNLILSGKDPLNFSEVMHTNSLIDVYPVEFTPVANRANGLQKRTVRTFVADGHLGKLTRNLRLLGFDVDYRTTADDRYLLESMQRENRALLTRDRRLLMHRVVQTGYYPRSQQAIEQTLEVIRRFDLFPSIAPFTRCLQCNAPLREASKTAVLDQLEPLTRIYYEDFSRCTGCGQVYWRGSHFDKLLRRVEELRTALGD